MKYREQEQRKMHRQNKGNMGATVRIRVIKQTEAQTIQGPVEKVNIGELPQEHGRPKHSIEDKPRGKKNGVGSPKTGNKLCIKTRDLMGVEERDM